MAANEDLDSVNGVTGAADLPVECVTTVLRFFTPEEFSRAACVRRQWRCAVENDEVYWEQQCSERFALATPKAFTHKLAETWRLAFLSWQAELGKHIELGRRACRAWRKIEDYAAANMPELLSTLRPGVSKAALDQCKVKMSPALRALVMVHNGQTSCNLNWTEADNSLTREMFHGVMGGWAMAGMWECVHLCDLKLDGRCARIDGKTYAFFARSVTGRKTFTVDMKTADLYLYNHGSGSFRKATPPGRPRSRDGVLRWMEAYADALASGVYKVEPLMGDQDPEPLCEVSRGISLFPQRPPLQAHPPAMRLSWSLHPDISGAQVEAVTRGVRVRASYIWVFEMPPQPNGPRPARNVFACRVRTALLPVAEQRASWPAAAGPFRALASVQLRAMRWVVRNAAGEVTTDIRGEAEHGEEGITLIQGGEESVYQFASHKVGSSYEGDIAIVEGGAHADSGFNAACPRIHLQFPDYIF